MDFIKVENTTILKENVYTYIDNNPGITTNQIVDYFTLTMGPDCHFSLIQNILKIIEDLKSEKKKE